MHRVVCQKMPQKLSYEFVKKVFDDAGCKLVSTEYDGCHKKLNYLCSCGSENLHEVSYQDFKNGSRCRDCRNDRLKATNLVNHGVEYIINKPGMKEKMLKGIMEYIDDKKYKIDKVKEIVEEAGCKLLSTEYKNTVTPLEIEFSCGCVGQPTFDTFLSGCRCSAKECMNKKKIATSIALYGSEWYTQTEEYKERHLQTCMDKYGVSHTSKLPSTLEKYKETMLKKYDVEFYFQTDEFKAKTKARCLDDFSVEYYAQTQNNKIKTIETNIIKYKTPVSSQNSNVLAKMVKTNMNKYNVPYTMMDPEIKDKSTQRILDIYSVDNVSKSSEIQQKKIESSRLHFGVDHPMQNPIIADRSSKNAFLTKEYTYPSGKKILVQGYENMALDILLKTYDEADIETEKSKMPEYWYIGDDIKYHKYFPDIWIAKDNLIIEVKSIYTYEMKKRNVDIKRKAVEYCGQTFKLMILQKNGQHIKI